MIHFSNSVKFLCSFHTFHYNMLIFILYCNTISYNTIYITIIYCIVVRSVNFFNSIPTHRMLSIYSLQRVFVSQIWKVSTHHRTKINFAKFPFYKFLSLLKTYRSYFLILSVLENLCLEGSIPRQVDRIFLHGRTGEIVR